MSKIRILPENLANQIAAGEVVERPASVIKELLENSIDAGAHDLTVEIEGGGTSLIRVIDDGDGMDQDDILLSLERHATSKLSRAEDLHAITTLGFRGEAIPSIASVSRMTITSRTSGADLGSRVEVRFGKVQKVHEMGCSRGTVIEVRDLFGNVPARRKFLKSARTEVAHIEEAVRNYGLVRPGLAISFRVNGREVLGLPTGQEDDMARRFRQLAGGFGADLVAVGGAPSADAGISIQGVLAVPDQAGAGGRLRVFVNDRPVRDRLLMHAVAEGLRNFLLKGRGPVGVLFLEMDPAEVDVNVHPAKQEVRFQRPQLIHQLVSAAVSKAMEDFQLGLKISLFGLPSGSLQNAVSKVAPSRPLPLSQPPIQPSPAYRQTHLEGMKLAEPRGDASPVPISRPTSPPESAPVRAPQPEERLEASPRLGHLRVIGQVLNSFILCESEEGLVAVDQHAAQERLLFEKFKAQVALGKVARQSLLFPVTVELSPGELAIFEETAAEFERLGLEVREFGGNTCLIQAVPALLSRLPPEEILRGILARHGRGSEGGAPSGDFRGLDDVLAVLSCKAAIKAHHPLSLPEMEALLKDMRDHDVFSHCPHGRPTVRIFGAEEIRKWFHRT